MATPGNVSDAVASDDVVTVLSATALVPVGVARSEQGSANRRKGRGSQGCCTRFIDYSIHKIFLPGTKLSRARCVEVLSFHAVAHNDVCLDTCVGLPPDMSCCVVALWLCVLHCCSCQP